MIIPMVGQKLLFYAKRREYIPIGLTLTSMLKIFAPNLAAPTNNLIVN